MVQVAAELRQRLERYGQDHVLRAWDRLNDAERSGWQKQLQRLDLEQLRQLYEQRNSTYMLPALDRLKPIPVVRLDVENQAARARGEETLRRGEVAVLLVAG